jgi:5-methylthioadenosine/S-adenosylhomocysteine deaminase
MNTLIKNALILPMTKENYTYRGDLKIENGKITDNPNFIAEKTIDATNMICMPSLINSHTHTSMELMRNYKDTAPDLMAWLSEIFPLEDKLIDNDIKWASKLAMAEMIESGCTTFNDMYFKQDNTCEGLLESGMRAKIGLTLFAGIEECKKREQSNNKFYNKYNNAGDGKISFSIAPHAIYTTPAESYIYANEWVKEHPGTMLHTHMCESMTEVKGTLKDFGKEPIKYLCEEGAFDGIKTIFAHCVHLTDEEIKLCADNNYSIVHNPSSNCKLASGIAPVAKYLKNGINVCLGTDGSSSNNNLNMFEEMHLAAMISNVSNMNPMATTPYQIIKMATLNGAIALGIDDKVGTLEVGKEADLILVDINKTHLTPLNDPLSALVFGVQGSDVDTVFCQGKILMENRKLLTLNKEEIIKNTNNCWTDLLSR